MEDDMVYVVDDVSYRNLFPELEKYGLHVDKCIGPLNLTCNSPEHFVQLYPNLLDDLIFWADSDEDITSWKYLPRAESRHHSSILSHMPTGQVRGLQNLAIYAAKVISLQKPELRGKIIEIGAKKRASYIERDILKEIGE